MAIGIRTYLLDDGGQLKRLPRRLRDGLVFGDDGIPEYAGTRQRVIEVVVENQDGRPARILDAKGAFWRFDDQGRIDKDLRESALAAMEFALESAPKARGKVVDLRPELKRKAFQNEHRWDVTAEDLDRIATDLWPGLADAPEVTVVKGKAPRKPAVSRDAREALSEIGQKFSAIDRCLAELSEHSLKGVAYEARRVARAYPLENGLLWTALAEEADRHREIQARHRTGRGRWYASVTLWLHEKGRRPW